MVLFILAVSLFGTWAILLGTGKGGFIHIILLNGIGVAVAGLVQVLRSRMTVNNKQT